MANTNPTQKAPSGSPAAASRDAVPARIGRFQVRRLLGTGAFARVYLGYDDQLRREVAIKVPKAEELDRRALDTFVAENRLAAIITHTNVCPIYEVGAHDGLPYIVMPVVPGTLAGLLGQLAGPMPPRTAAAFARKVALGLAAAHARNVVHRDLKPANVLYDESSREVLIADFGLARFADQATEASNGVPKGTPAYMPPEQARGRAPEVGPHSDVYSLGVILYEMLTGRVPFVGTVWEVMRDHCETEPVAPAALRPEIDPRLDAICMKALAKAPADRYPSGAEFAEELSEFLRATKGAPPPAPAAHGSAAGARPIPPPLPPGLTATAPPTGTAGRTGPPPLPKALVSTGAGPVPSATETAKARSTAVAPPPLPRAEPVPGDASAGARRRWYARPAVLAGTAVALIAVLAVLLARRGGADGELVHDWDDYRRAALTTGSVPFFHERGPKRAGAWQRAADRDARAALLLARALQEGTGTDRDPAAAVGWLRKSARTEPAGMTNLGACYLDGLGITKDVAEAARWFRAAADLGDPLGMLFLGDCYERGLGVAEDKVEALKWYTKAADAGSARGMSAIGECHFYGKGTRKNADEAVKWYRKAAELGEPYAMSGLGDACEYGNGVPKNAEEAVKWIRRAADVGHVPALLRLGKRAGEPNDPHVSYSPTEALALVERAKAADTRGAHKYEIAEELVRAQARLAEIDTKAGRLAEARTRLVAARDASEELNRARPGRFYFMQDLGRIWFELGNVERAQGQPAAAAECYRRAIAVDGPGQTKATGALADLLESGAAGVPRDPTKAKELRDTVAKQKIKRFTVPSTVGEHGKVPVHVYVFDVFDWKHPLETQNRYFKEERGFELPKDVMDSFEKLHKIAKENNVSFVDLCEYALGEAKKDDPPKKK